MNRAKLHAILAKHMKWLADKGGERADLSEANLSEADLSGADLSGADLSGVTLCNATIDGAIVKPDDIGGPGHILYALTDEEAARIAEGREA